MSDYHRESPLAHAIQSRRLRLETRGFDVVLTFSSVHCIGPLNFGSTRAKVLISASVCYVLQLYNKFCKIVSVS